MTIYGIWEEHYTYECNYEGYLEEFFTDENKAKIYLMSNYIPQYYNISNYIWENNKLIDKEERKIDHLHSFEIRPISIDKIRY